MKTDRPRSAGPSALRCICTCTCTCICICTCTCICIMVLPKNKPYEVPPDNFCEIEISLYMAYIWPIPPYIWGAARQVCILYVCMYVCVYIYIYTHTYYVYVYICIYIYIYIYPAPPGLAPGLAKISHMRLLIVTSSYY